MTKPKSRRVPGECVHHWMLPEPSGPVAHSRCKKCGAEHEFQNYFDIPEILDGHRLKKGLVLRRDK